jgi:hypothetical protein
MTPKTTSRTLMIFWRWQDLQKVNADYDTVYVSGDEQARLIRVNEAKKEHFAKILETIAGELAKTEKSLEKSLILMLHQAAITKEEWENIAKNNSKYDELFIASPVFFSGGNNFLYYKPDRDSGLINGNGGLVINEPFRIVNEQTGDREGIRVSVVEHSEHTYMIKRKYFDEVWHYYQYRPKKHLFEFKENLFSHLIGLKAIQKQTTLPEFLRGHWLHDRFLNILNISDFYQSANNMETAQTAYDELIRFINNERFHDSYLENLRDRFAAIFNEMKEMIYG